MHININMAHFELHRIVNLVNSTGNYADITGFDLIYKEYSYSIGML
jgi:hypothetical protein